MTQHFLVKNATRKPYRAVPEMSETSFYNDAKGYWEDGDGPLVQSKDYLENGPVSKKCDMETGEDQKGE